MLFSGQFNYTKNRVFHAILLPVFIGFSRCIGAYSSAKFELTDDDEFDGHILSYRQVLIAQNEEGVRSITLKSRLGYLFLARFEIIFEYLDYKMDEFIQKVVDTRNYYTHYSIDKKEKIFPKHQMPYVNGILLGVLQYYILKEIGIKDEHIKKAVGQQMAGVSHSYDAIK